jgi:hypothetical protein
MQTESLRLLMRLTSLDKGDGLRRAGSLARVLVAVALLLVFFVGYALAIRLPDFDRRRGGRCGLDQVGHHSLWCHCDPKRPREWTVGRGRIRTPGKWIRFVTL